MKEKLEIAEKSTLLFIPYLIVLSLAYYWGYWGYFDIDAISYYGVQDLIKGFTYSLPVVLLLGIAFIIVNAIMDSLVNAVRKKFNSWLAGAIFLIPAAALLWITIDKIAANTVIHWEIVFLALLIISTFLEALFSAIAKDWQWAIDNSMMLFALKWIAIFCFVSFISSYAYGRNKAMDISNNKYFSYMKLSITADTTKPKQIFKYLGKAGESYFFISPDNKEKRIVAAGIIPVLVLHDCDVSDSASVRMYNFASSHK